MLEYLFRNVTENAGSTLQQWHRLLDFVLFRNLSLDIFLKQQVEQYRQFWVDFVQSGLDELLEAVVADEG